MTTKPKPKVDYIEERVPGGGYVVLDNETARCVWQVKGDTVEVNNHSNWGPLSQAQHEEAAIALAAQFTDKKIKKVRDLTRG